MQVPLVCVCQYRFPVRRVGRLSAGCQERRFTKGTSQLQVVQEGTTLTQFSSTYGPPPPLRLRSTCERCRTLRCEEREGFDTLPSAPGRSGGHGVTASSSDARQGGSSRGKGTVERLVMSRVFLDFHWILCPQDPVNRVVRKELS